MNIYELLKNNEQLLRLMADNRVSMSDFKILNVVSEVYEMREQGNKMTYIVKHLAEKYNLGERTIYLAVQKLSKQVKNV